MKAELVPREASAVLPVERVRAAIRECVTIPDVKHLRDRLVAIETFTRHRKAHEDVRQSATEGVLWAEREIGARTKELPKAKGVGAGRPPKGGEKSTPTVGEISTKEATLAALGVTNQDASRWEKLADLPEKEFEERIEAVKAAGEKLTRAAVSTAVHVANNSGENEWYTPTGFLEAARAAMGGIDCDPASSEVANRSVRAATFFTAQDDGLAQKWFGRVWMNPPYAQPLCARFAEAVASKYEAGEIQVACVLVNNATETAWFQRMARVASAACFPTGRIKFLDPSGGATGAPLQGQAVLYFGKEPTRFASQFSEFGLVMVPA